MALLAYIVALVCFLVAVLAGFGALGSSHILGWIALGLLCSTLAGAYTIWGARPNGGLRL